MAHANHPVTAPSAAHAATGPAPAPGTPPAPGSPAAAVRAALAASPGATVTAIADAAGTGKPAARAALLAMEKDGTATRVKGGKPSIPDAWTLAGPASDDDSPAEAVPAEAVPAEAVPAEAVPAEAVPAEAAARDEQAGQPGDGTASPDLAADEAGEAAAPGQEDADAGTGASTEAAAEPGTSAEPGPATAEPGVHGHAPAEGDAAAGDDPEPGRAGDPAEDAAQEDSGGEDDNAPDEALVSQLTECLDQVRAAADAAELVLTASGDLKTVLAGMDEIFEQAAEARRSLKAAVSGRKAPAVRPGGLRDKILAHLLAHPGKDFGPHELHKVLGHSNGAIANALDTLVKLGQAELASEKPRRFRLAPQPAGAAPGADSAQDEDTALPGAA